MKATYWIVTGLLSLMMLASATMYIVRHDQIAEVVESLGFPSFILYPLAIAKILGVLAITTRKYPVLTEWAYAGFFYDFVLALSAHLIAKDGEFAGAAVALVLLAVSYFLGKRVRPSGQAIG